MMVDLQRLRVEPGDRPPIRRADRYEFIILLSGAADLFFDGRTRRLQSGHGAAVLPGEVRALGGNWQGAAEAALLSFDAAWGETGSRLPLVRAVAALGPGERAERDLGPELLPTLERRERAAEADSEAGENLREAILESLCLDIALEFLLSAEDRRARGAPVWLRKACAAMERGKNLRRGGARLAELSGKSPEHVIRQMRRYYDMTPTQFVNDLRLRRASELLVASERPVLDISYSLGFENPSYFSQLFKEKYGMPPTRFRAGRRG